MTKFCWTALTCCADRAFIFLLSYWRNINLTPRAIFWASSLWIYQQFRTFWLIYLWYTVVKTDICKNDADCILRMYYTYIYIYIQTPTIRKWYDISSTSGKTINVPNRAFKNGFWNQTLLMVKFGAWLLCYFRNPLECDSKCAPL